MPLTRSSSMSSSCASPESRVRRFLQCFEHIVVDWTSPEPPPHSASPLRCPRTPETTSPLPSNSSCCGEPFATRPTPGRSPERRIRHRQRLRRRLPHRRRALRRHPQVSASRPSDLRSTHEIRSLRTNGYAPIWIVRSRSDGPDQITYTRQRSQSAPRVSHVSASV